MISTKDRHKILNDSHLLSGFIREVKSAPDTPWLIQWVAAEAARMILCDAVVNVKKDQDEPLYNRLKAHCRNQGISFPNLQDPLQAVARSLGLVVSETQVDFYDLLGVPQNVDTGKIRRAYRQKAYDMHPDTRKDGRAETAEFIALNAAYETLTDPVLRTQYDRSRRNISVWKEGSRPASRKRKTRRLKPVYQLAWVLLFLVVIAYIFDMIYRENAMTTGYRSAENDAPLSKKIENILPPKKVLGPRDLSDLSGPLVSDLTGKTPPAKPPLPEIPLFPAGFEKNSTSSQLKMGRDMSDIKQKNSKTDPSTFGKSRKLKATNKAESEYREFIAVFDHVQISVNGLLLRKSPGTDGKMIREMAKGESGRVVGGPERVDGFIWWALKLKNGDTGWVTEKKVSTSTGNLVQMIRVLPRTDSQSRPKPVTVKKKSTPILAMKSPQLIPTPAKAPDIIQKPPKSDTLQSFLDRYCKTYEKRDLEAFSLLFTADATENGEPFQKLWPLYRQTFHSIERIEYTIKLLEHAVELYTRTIHLKGRFKLKWRTIAGGREHKSTGTIELVLLQDPKKGFLVKKMTYRYQS